MRRQEKYPNNDFFTYFNANPKNKIGGDCVIRAICTATNQSWETTIRELTELGIKLGYVCNDKHVYEKYLESKGYYKHNEPRNDDNKKMNIREFIKKYDIKNAIAHAGSHHLVAIVDGKVHDIWDSSKATAHVWWRK